MVDSPDTGGIRWKMAGEALDGWLTSLYGRHRRNYIHICTVATAVIVEVSILPLGQVLGAVYGAGPNARLLLSLQMMVAALFGVPILFFVVLIHHRPAIEFLRNSGTPPEPEAVWRTSVVELPTAVTQIVFGYVAPLVIGMHVVAHSLHLDLLRTVAVDFAITISAAFLGVLFFLLWEAALRPLVRELAPQLADDLSGHYRGVSLSSKLFVLLLLISLFNGYSAGAMSLYPRSAENRIVVMVTGTVALSAVLAATVVWLLRNSFVSRIDELRHALERVEAGEREGFRLPPLAGDDLDEVTGAFNRMVRELSLREAGMRASQARIVAVADAERRRMERDLHDGAQQYLALMGLQLSSAIEAAGSNTEMAANLDEMRSTLADAQAELRNLAHGIYPASLESEGVAAALREAASRATVPVSVESHGVGPLPREVAAAVYFCCLEALQNVSKYAGDGAEAVVRLAQVDHQVAFTVTDDGIGFDVAANGHGLTNMQDRIGALGGQVTVTSAPGEGTTVGGWVPVG